MGLAPKCTSQKKFIKRVLWETTIMKNTIQNKKLGDVNQLVESLQGDGGWGNLKL